MAKQTNSSVHYQGTIGDIRHFKIKGRTGYFAGLKGGATRDQILNNPNFKRTRENMSEFAGAAYVSKAIRSALQGTPKAQADTLAYARLSKLVHRIKKADTLSPRGKRSFLISGNKPVLDGFEFNTATPFSTVFRNPYTVTDNPDKVSATLTVPVFTPSPANMLIPSGATHFRLVMAVGAVSDYAYNDESQTYEPINGQADGTSSIIKSDWLPIDTELTEPLTLTSSIGETDMESATLLKAVGAEFSQQLGTDHYPLFDIRTLKLVV